MSMNLSLRLGELELSDKLRIVLTCTETPSFEDLSESKLWSRNDTKQDLRQDLVQQVLEGTMVDNN